MSATSMAIGLSVEGWAATICNLGEHPLDSDVNLFHDNEKGAL